MNDVAIRRLTPDDWEAYRDIRLAALADSPDAFGSTLAKSRLYTEHIWRSRLTTAAFFATVRGDELVGSVGGLPAQIPGTAALIGMWVSPTARGLGLGEALVQRVIQWAVDEGFTRLELTVTNGNETAERLYRRCGFTVTGPADPIGRVDRELQATAMARALIS